MEKNFFIYFLITIYLFLFSLYISNSPYVVSIGVGAAAEAHGTVTVEKLLKEGATGQPHPASCIHTPVCIQQQLLENLWRHMHVSAATEDLSY